MKFVVKQKDPLRVLSSTKSIVENLRYVRVHEDKLPAVSNKVKKRLKVGLDTVNVHFGKVNDIANGAQLIFLEDVVNFCFWAEKNKPKWQIKYKGKLFDGWYAIGASFKRAIAEGAPVLNANFLTNLTLRETEKIFRGDTEIPLLRERMRNLQEAGKILIEKYRGEFINVLKKTNFDAIKLVKILIKDFPSFRDVEKFDGKEICFLKRAQICAQDISYLREKFPQFSIKNINLLTAFADYKIPQILREYGAISYSKSLGNKIDKHIIIKKASREEIEIRAATIWCVELIRQILEKYPAADIDNALWLISQKQTNMKPYHRTYTIYY